ncbi:MAG: FemAB family PEP-CTERM system-associated protein, partial [Proteobacteria bacterium]
MPEKVAPGAWSVSVRSEPSADWDAFVRARPSASVYMLSGWAELVRTVFGHAAFFIEARDAAGALAGILPVIRQRRFLLGNFATSLPFFNYGGALTDHAPLATRLMEQARVLAEELGCSYLEFRDTQPREGDWTVRTDKVGMVLELPPTFDELARRLGSKLRSQVRRAEREAPQVRVGGAALLDDFYDVFAHNMRDLGTPVYPRRFFAAILERFPDHCRLVVVYRAGTPAAAGFVVLYNGRAEIPWAACRAEAKPLGFNMRLYWEVLDLAVREGCTSFDFGRSTVDAGTYRFKKQWGAQPVQLYWHRWQRRPDRQAADGAPQRSRFMQYAT